MNPDQDQDSGEWQSGVKPRNGGLHPVGEPGGFANFSMTQSLACSAERSTAVSRFRNLIAGLCRGWMSRLPGVCGGLFMVRCCWRVIAVQTPRGVVLSLGDGGDLPGLLAGEIQTASVAKRTPGNKNRCCNRSSRFKPTASPRCRSRIPLSLHPDYTGHWQSFLKRPPVAVAFGQSPNALRAGSTARRATPAR